MRARYRLDVQLAQLDADEVPEHLRMRIEIEGGDYKPLAAGRNLKALKQ